jgi:serine protease Do
MGVYIVSVEEGSTAEFAGLQVGDVIIGIQGEAITTADELNEIKNQYKAGEEITLTITRDGEDMDISLVLQEANANSSSENSDDDDDSDTSSDSNDDVEESPSR